MNAEPIFKLFGERARLVQDALDNNHALIYRLKSVEGRKVMEVFVDETI